MQGSTLIQVFDKSTGEGAEVPLAELEASTNSVFKVPVGPEQVESFEARGDDLLIVLQSGEEVTIPDFFVGEATDERNELVLEDADGVMWWGQYESPWSEFSFAEINTVDDVIAAEGGFGILPWVLGAAALGAAAFAIGGSSSSSGGGGGGGGGNGDGLDDSDDPDALNAPTVQQQNLEGIGGFVQGAGEGDEVILRDANGQDVATVVVDSEGRWLFLAEEPDLPDGTTLADGVAVLPDDFDIRGFEGTVVAVRDDLESDPADVNVPALLLSDVVAQANLVANAENVFVNELDDLVLEGQLLGIGTGPQSDSLEFEIGSNTLGFLSFDVSGGSLATLLGQGFEVTLTQLGDDGEVVEVIGGEDILLDVNLATLLGSNDPESNSAVLGPGNYELTLSRDGELVSLLDGGAELTNIELTTFSAVTDLDDANLAVDQNDPITGNVVTDPGITGMPDFAEIPPDTFAIQDADGEFVELDPGDNLTIIGNFGTLEVTGDGSYVYEPNAEDGDLDNVGETDVFTYQVTFPDTGESATAELRINIGVEFDGDVALPAESNTGDALTIDALMVAELSEGAEAEGSSDHLADESQLEDQSSSVY